MNLSLALERGEGLSNQAVEVTIRHYSTSPPLSFLLAGDGPSITSASQSLSVLSPLAHHLVNLLE